MQRARRKKMSFSHFREQFVNDPFISFANKDTKRKIADDFEVYAKGKRLDMTDAEYWLNHWNRFVTKARNEKDRT